MKKRRNEQQEKKDEHAGKGKTGEEQRAGEKTGDIQRNIWEKWENKKRKKEKNNKRNKQHKEKEGNMLHSFKFI